MKVFCITVAAFPDKFIDTLNQLLAFSIQHSAGSALAECLLPNFKWQQTLTGLDKN
ncbi:MAG: hypothetical protein F6K65_36540 [Moorea sp. SIO3C2]|nr:hypothetical protein [Moorena sp. SIO3C2]